MSVQKPSIPSVASPGFWMVKISHKMQGNSIFTFTFTMKINLFNVAKYTRPYGIPTGIVKQYTTTVCCRHNMVFPPHILTCLHAFTSCQRDIQVHLAKLLYFTNLEFFWKKGFWGWKIGRLRVAIPWPTVDPEGLALCLHFVLACLVTFQPPSLETQRKVKCFKKKSQVLLVPFANHEDPTKWRDPEKQVRSCKKNALCETYWFQHVHII